MVESSLTESSTAIVVVMESATIPTSSTILISASPSVTTELSS